jgi:transposase
LTTKLHAACLDEHTAVTLVLSEGQRHDSIPVPDLIAEAPLSARITRVTADRTYDGAPVRQPLPDQGVQLVIPVPAHRKQPEPCPPQLCRLWHKLENFFRKLSDFRRNATRYDKLSKSYLACVQLVASIVL